MQLNTQYKATCLASGVGKYADIYKDLGDVHGCNFKQWWTERAYLFSELKKGYRMMVATSIVDIAPFDSDEVLNLVVPLTRSQRSLKKSFAQLVLKRVEKGKRGISVEHSEAQYRLSGRWNIDALKYAYRIYQIKHSVEQGKKLAWADVAIRAQLPYAIGEGAKEGVRTDATVDIRATLTILATRHYKRAEAFIEAAASKSFPYLR